MSVNRTKSDIVALLRRHRFLVAGALIVVLAVILTVLLWPAAPAHTLPTPRSRAYTAFDACLLTGAHGLADPATGPVWAGMQDASNATRAKVSYLSIAAGPDNVGNALPYLAALLQRHCDVILAVGSAEVAAVIQDAPENPGTHFIEIGGSNSAANVSVVPNGPTADIRNSVSGLLSGLVH